MVTCVAEHVNQGGRVSEFQRYHEKLSSLQTLQVKREEKCIPQCLIFVTPSLN